jgi:PPM family protein phosphatase
MDDLPQVEVTVVSHTGAVRENNEDSLAVAGWVLDGQWSTPRQTRHTLAQPLVFAVADGMGGHAGGEIASGHATKRLSEAPIDATAGALRARLEAINKELYQTMKAVPSLLGMGTTVAGLLLSAARVLWFNVGDSRIYRFRPHRLEQLSIDDVPPGPRSGLITQTLGGAPIFVPIAPHIGEDALVVPSRWLLCSDGLTEMLDDADIECMLATNDEAAVRGLFAAAMDAGGTDNISIVLASVNSG